MARRSDKGAKVRPRRDFPPLTVFLGVLFICLVFIRDPHTSGNHCESLPNNGIERTALNLRKKIALSSGLPLSGRWMQAIRIQPGVICRHAVNGKARLGQDTAILAHLGPQRRIAEQTNGAL